MTGMVSRATKGKVTKVVAMTMPQGHPGRSQRE